MKERLGKTGGMRRGAFTLIELLIVVAIIAILAAIAVPNFLEAQVRSKVARVRGDMRTLAVAVESYRVDHNRYPGDPYDWQRWVGASPFGWDWVLIACTTPVAYMTAIPEDPFLDIYTAWGVHTWYFTKTGYYANRHSKTDPAAYFIGPRENYVYCINSPGPDMFWEFDRGDGDHDKANSTYRFQGDVLYYDPSNGTRSQGDLYYFGPGGGYNPPPHPDRK